MKIAVLSDIHDNIWNLSKTVQLIKEKSCEAIIFCGDFCSPFIPSYLNETGLPVYACFGNNDEDQGTIIAKSNSQNFHFYPLAQEFAEIELDNKKIAFCHYPKLGSLLAKTGAYAAVFHGHTHDSYKEIVDKTLLANPGSICGIKSGKPGQASFGIYNTSDDTFTLINL